MITVQEWRHATIAADEDNVQRDRKAIGAGLEHVRLARWKVDLPPTAPVYDAGEPAHNLGAGDLHINIAAHAVATILAGQVQWVRVEPVGVASRMIPTLKDLFSLAARPNEFLLLGVRVTSGKIERWFLRPVDLLAQDRPPNFAPSTWSPWRPDGIFVAGLPRPSPRDAVRRVVAAWITRGRADRLPWEPS